MLGTMSHSFIINNSFLLFQFYYYYVSFLDIYKSYLLFGKPIRNINCELVQYKFLWWGWTYIGTHLPPTHFLYFLCRSRLYNIINTYSTSVVFVFCFDVSNYFSKQIIYSNILFCSVLWVFITSWNGWLPQLKFPISFDIMYSSICISFNSWKKSLFLEFKCFLILAFCS